MRAEVIGLVQALGGKTEITSAGIKFNLVGDKFYGKASKDIFITIELSRSINHGIYPGILVTFVKTTKGIVAQESFRFDDSLPDGWYCSLDTYIPRDLSHWKTKDGYESKLDPDVISGNKTKVRTIIKNYKGR